MRVFVAGATGAIGRPLVTQLLAAGHDVIGLARTEARAHELRQRGAEAAVGDALDAERLIKSVLRAKPDAVIHQLTAIPHEIHPRKVGRQFERTNRLRTEATRSLIEGARQAGARRFLAQSIAFAYRSVGGPVKTEEDPLWDDPPAAYASSMNAILDLERQVQQTASGIVLRYGFFYGPGTAYARDGSAAHRVRERQFPIVADGTGTFSFIHVEDAAAATIAALERGATGVYNVVDDEPAPVREWLPVYAEVLGAPSPRRVPKFLARLIAGRYGIYMMTELRGASNAKAKASLGWSPRYASWRTGFREALGTSG